MVRLAPLREHGDTRLLAQALWKRIGYGRRLSPAALDALAGYGWPGNTRQMVACLRMLVALSEPGGVIDSAALPAYLHERMPTKATQFAGTPLHAASQDLQTLSLSAMRAAVDACGGNVANAARKIGISRSILYRRLGSDPRMQPH